jgi:predicted nucleic acid-binding protein
MLVISFRKIRQTKFFSCAIEGGADVIVSGDRHLLNLKKFKGISVVPVNEFIDLLKANKS